MATRRASNNNSALMILGQVLVFAIILALLAKAGAIIGVIVGAFVAWKVVTAR